MIISSVYLFVQLVIYTFSCINLLSVVGVVVSYFFSNAGVVCKLADLAKYMDILVICSSHEE